MSMCGSRRARSMVVRRPRTSSTLRSGCLLMVARAALMAWSAYLAGKSHPASLGGVAVLHERVGEASLPDA